MAQYVLAPGQWSATTLPAQVGSTYNVGLSDGTHYYGYLFQNKGQQTVGFSEASDVTSKEALTQFSSGQLIDRDLAFYPRVTDGDFSGGGYQSVWLDTTKYFDSDLDPRVPGYLQLRPQWARFSKAGLTVGSNFQVVAWNGDFLFTLGEANGNVYSVNGAGTISPVAAPVVSLATDGQYLYVGTATQLYRAAAGTGFTAVTSAINGTASRWWVLNQGTGGYFAYYKSGNNLLYKIDLTQGFPIAAAAQPQVPLGGNAVSITDLVEYQNGLAILTQDITQTGFDVWFHDGTNLTRIIRMESYIGQGICTALGNLFVGAYALGQTSSPILALVSGGQFQIVAKPGSPFPVAGQVCWGPVSAGQFVYWPILNPTIKGISTTSYVVQYDVATGAITHLPNQDATDYASGFVGGPVRTLAVFGDAVAICYANGTTGILQYQLPAFGTLKYQSAGWLVSSRIDFGTPGISKRFRRLEVTHAPLNAGESIVVRAFVDRDPLSFTTALAAVPASATAANSTAGSILTSLTVGADTVGKSLYFAIQLNAGTSQLTTPRVAYCTVEVGGTWVWEFDLDCTSKRRLLNQAAEDAQGVSGKDLDYLIRNAYENGSNLTLYLASGLSYTVAVENRKAVSASYVDHTGTTVKADEEFLTHVILRQVA